MFVLSCNWKWQISVVMFCLLNSNIILCTCSLIYVSPRYFKNNFRNTVCTEVYFTNIFRTIPTCIIPTVSVLLATRNDPSATRTRLANMRALDFWPPSLDVWHLFSSISFSITCLVIICRVMTNLCHPKLSLNLVKISLRLNRVRKKSPIQKIQKKQLKNQR